MKNRNLYTAIASTVIATNLYNLFWILKSILQSDFQFRHNTSFLIYGTPTFLALTGGILFLSSRFRRSSLLRIYMCYYVISYPLWHLIEFVSTRPQPDDSVSIGYDLFYYIGVSISLLDFIACSIGLWFLTKERVLKTYYNATYDKRVLQFFPASKAKRLSNRLVDLAVIIFILFKNFVDNYYLRHSDVADYLRSENAAFIIEVFFAVVFYIILEGIFKTTPGKCATNTIIVNEGGKTASFGQIVGRTLSRLIPFEAFSFLGSTGRGWHDTISETYVAESIYAENKAKQKPLPATDEPDYLTEFYKTRSFG